MYSKVNEIWHVIRLLWNTALRAKTSGRPRCSSRSARLMVCRDDDGAKSLLVCAHTTSKFLNKEVNFDPRQLMHFVFEHGLFV